MQFVKTIKCFLKESRGGPSQSVIAGMHLSNTAYFMMTKKKKKNELDSKLPSRVFLHLCSLPLTVSILTGFYIFLG